MACSVCTFPMAWSCRALPDEAKSITNLSACNFVFAVAGPGCTGASVHSMAPADNVSAFCTLPLWPDSPLPNSIRNASVRSLRDSPLPACVSSSTLLFRVTSLGRPSQGHNSKVVTLNNNRSEEHTSELQSRQYLVCRLLLE